MAEPIFNVVDDAVFRFTPTSGNTGVNEIVITKEIFIECYEKWIKGKDKESERYGKNNGNLSFSVVEQ